MKQTTRHSVLSVLAYGLVGGVLIAALRWMDYRFLVVEHSAQIYGGMIAATFAGLGIWLGVRLTARRELTTPVATPVPREAQPVFRPDEKSRAELGITPREYEILALMADGMSNREIAQKLFVSENTVKTHTSRVLGKLGAKRRTQAVLLGKQLGLLP